MLIHVAIMQFNQFGLDARVLNNLQAEGYTQPTPIQQQAIPYVLEEKDVFGMAQTGTGKTAAFALPILQLLLNTRQANAPHRTEVLVLAPTRELAAQIADSFIVYGKGLGFRTAVIFGGVSQRPQEEAIRKGIDILVATPGRLLDLMNQGVLRLDTIRYLVLDEVDRMLDMGFIHDIRRILPKLPAQRQTLFFSATAPEAILKLSSTLLRNPVQVRVAAVSAPAETVQQAFFYVEKTDKAKVLLHILKNEIHERVLVFSRTKHGSDRIARVLTKAGITTAAIHGDKSQGARERALAGFKGNKIRVLVATDIAARGIDIDELAFVINYDIPEVAETYVHRIGRTGRAGSSGSALSFCSSEEKPYLADIRKLVKDKLVMRETPIAKDIPRSENGSSHNPDWTPASERKTSRFGRKGNFNASVSRSSNVQVGEKKPQQNGNTSGNKPRNRNNNRRRLGKPSTSVR